MVDHKYDLSDQRSGRVLGVDYGERRIGVALSDERHIFAQALTTLQRRRGGDESAAEQIKTLVTEHSVTQIVIGWPLRLNGKEGIQTQKVGRFIECLQPLGLIIHKWDERLSTVSAERALRDSGVKGSSRRAVIDQVAAAVILQAWLDAQSAMRS